MPRRALRAHVPRALPLLLLAAATAGCAAGEVQDRAGEIASAAAGSASQAGAGALRDQVCQVVSDRKVSEQDLQVLASVADAARAAGLDAEVLGPLEELVAAEGDLPPDAVKRLVEACQP